MKRTILTVFATLLLVGLAGLIPYEWPHVVGGGELPEQQLKLLTAAASAALTSHDAPVGALLLSGDQIIGTGHNTVKRDGNAGGHAEINAISDVLAKIGLDAFNQLDKDRLTIISTYEPCRMCRGALLEYGITHVQFLKPKPLTRWIREDLRAVLYELRRRQRGPEGLQDSLFQMSRQNN